MTEQTTSEPQSRAPRRRRSLYRTVLSIGTAAIVAAWLPFSIIYINALGKHASTVASQGASGTARAAAGGQSTGALTPVVTRTS